MNSNTHRLLIEAVNKGDEVRVRSLLDEGADVNSATTDGRTALHFASSKGNTVVVEVLLARGANVNAALVRRGRTALHCATQHGHAAVVQMLLANGANANSIDECDFTPLHWASYKNRVEIADLLLDHGANIEALNHVGHTALHDAVRFGDVSDALIRLLLRRGASVHDQTDNGASSLHYAAWHGRDDTIGLLIDAGAVLDVTDNQGRPPLFYATRGGHRKTAALLLALCPDAAAHERTADEVRVLFARESIRSMVVSALEGPALSRRRAACIAWLVLRCLCDM